MPYWAGTTGPLDDETRGTMGRYQAGIQTEARIIDATRTLLAERGLEGTTLKAICELAEVRAGSFYNLFDSKEEAVIRVVRESIQAVDPDPEGIGSDTLDDLVSAYVRFFETDPLLANVYVRAALSAEASGDGARRRFLRHHLRRVERFAGAIGRADTSLSEEEAATSAELLLGTLDGLAFRWSLDNDFPFASYAREATNLFR